MNVEIKRQRFILLRDQTNLELTTTLHKLGTFILSQWVVVTELLIAKAKTLKCYREIAEAVKLFKNRFSWEYLMSVNRKTLYWDTVEINSATPLSRSISGSKYGMTVLRRLRKFPISSVIDNIYSRIRSEILSVKPWLKSN